ncbi:MAG: glycosyltransferase [Rhodoglobus sp.]
MAPNTKRALIVVKSAISRDPRVLRQIQWLSEEGYDIDTVGPAGEHAPGVDTHYGVPHAPAWTRDRRLGPLLYALLPHSGVFRYLIENRIPREVKRRVVAGEYDLLLFNDHHYLPWVENLRVFTPTVVARGIHLDMHEYVAARAPRTTRQEVLTARYKEWVRSFVGSTQFTSHSTVADGIARLYREEFDLGAIAVVRSAPPYEALSPSPVDSTHIQLLHHGAAHDNRGIPELLEAMETLPERFTLTLVLVGDPAKVAEYRHRAKSENLRVSFVDPVPVHEIATFINTFDAEVMFFPPRTRNLEFALPNKLFEALQARLALVMGESAMMTEIVREYDNGVIATGWTTADLTSAIETLTPENVRTMKSNSDRAAREISAETERVAFLASIARQPS